jgi:hypothetical protein
MSNTPTIWTGSEEVSIPSNAKDVKQIMPLAGGLSRKQQQYIVDAINTLEAYDMAVEYTWKKTITRLKESLSTLGMQFIGEMLGRADITDNTPFENAITDFQAIQLSEQLGLLNPTAGLKLRHIHELVSHYFSSRATEEIDRFEAMNVIKNAVKYVLGHEQMQVAVGFSNFRDRLLSETLRSNDMQLEAMVSSPVFYGRTVSFVLLNSIMKEEGAKLEHGLANLNTILPMIWEKLTDNDRYNVGFAYRDVVSSNNVAAASGLKQALMKVGGFDYVPESLRSNTFIKAARNVVEVHYAMNNFYNEPSAVATLANLGSTIPTPAFFQCMQAYLVVCIGNRYGVSLRAMEIAKEQLFDIPEDRWKHYLQKGINDDNEVLSNLRSSDQILRLSNLIIELGLKDVTNLPKDNQRLYNALVKRSVSAVEEIAVSMYEQIKT